jgi:GxxExxY protein
MLRDMRTIDALAYRTIGCAMAVHKALGPGVLETPIVHAFAMELAAQEIPYRRDVPVDLWYKGQPLGCGYRLDLLIDDTIIVEVKSVRQITDVHQKQLLSYLKLTGRPLGLLINFNVPILRDGISRTINSAQRRDDAIGVVRPLKPPPDEVPPEVLEETEG